MNNPGPGSALPVVPGYRVEAKIGSGGMGTVYRARQLSLDRPVAIKFLSNRGSGGGRAGDDFDREARVLARLAHPNIVAVIDCGRTGEGQFIVMEYVEGGNLRQRMKGGRTFPPGEVVAMLQPVCDALDYIHGQGVLHCDLKPENILLSTDGRTRVADFGLAGVNARPGLSPGHMAAGTVDYVSPEQAQRLAVDHRTDVYSLAVMTYEMLTGELPLGVFDPPSIRRPELPGELDSELERALRRDPDERTPRVREFIAGLRGAASKDAAPPAPPRLSRRVAGVTILLLLLCGLLWSHYDRRPATVKPGAVGQRSPELDGNAPEPGRLNLNTVTRTELEALPGIGEVLAGRIIEERARRGGFERMDELREVEGIGDSRLRTLRQFLTTTNEAER